jgi:beta-galactosidase
MVSSRGKGISLCFLLLIIFAHTQAQSVVASRNDHIFPAAQSAKPFIDYDKKSFLINGKRVFIASAGMEYARATGYCV